MKIVKVQNIYPQKPNITTLKNNNLKSWLLAIRVKTLGASFSPIIAASALLYADLQGEKPFQVFSCVLLFLALLCSLLIQIATNLFNDAIDYKKGADTSERLGPVRVTQAGLIPYSKVLFVARVSVLLAALIGIYLVYQGGWMIFLIGILSLFLSYGYTSGPFPISYLGLGEVFVIIFFGIIPVSGIEYLVNQNFTWNFLLLGTQIGLLAAVLIAINNIRDIEEDTKSKKRTLAVKMGKRNFSKLLLLLIFAPYLLGIFWILEGRFFVAFLSLLTLKSAQYISKEVCRLTSSANTFPNSNNLKLAMYEEGTNFNLLLGKAAKLQISFSLLTSLAFLLERFVK